MLVMEVALNNPGIAMVGSPSDTTIETAAVIIHKTIYVIMIRIKLLLSKLLS